MRSLKYAILAWFALSSVALADPIWGRGAAGLADDTALGTTSPLGGGGALSAGLTLTCTTCVTATSAFGTDNVLVRSDGTGRGTQATGLIVDDSNLLGLGLTPTHALTLPAASTGLAIYNVTGTERAVCAWVANVFTCGPEANGGTSRGFQLKTDAYGVLLGATAGANGMLLTGGNSSQFYITSGTSATGVRVVGNITTTATPVMQVAPNASLTGSTASQVALSVTGTFNQTSTATATALLLNPTFTAVGSGGGYFARGVDNATERFRVDSAGTPTFASGTAPPASGSTVACVKLSSTANLGFCVGDGAPTFSAAKGTLYSNTTGTTTTTRIYVNTDGGTTWTTITTGS